MDRQVYFDELRATSNYVRPFLRNYLLGSVNGQNGLSETVGYLANERLKNNVLLLKPFVVRLAYEAAGGKDWKRIAPICAAAEILNLSSYQSNLSFDGKFRVLSQGDRNNQFIASMICREAVTRIMRDLAAEIGQARSQEIHNCFSTSNYNIYVGQYLDLNRLVLQKCQAYEKFEHFLKDYLERCRRLSGVFTEQCALVGGLLADADRVALQKLMQFGRNFGIGLQIINDIGDLLPPDLFEPNSFRMTCDQFGDLRSKKLTLPIFYVIEHNNGDMWQRLRSLSSSAVLSRREMMEASNIFIQSGAIHFTKSLAKAYMKQAKRALRCLPYSKARVLLSLMASQIRTNKFFAAFRKV